jgi:DNA-binding CsgD family transcriptional regulator
MSAPTARELEVLAASLRLGQKCAAIELGISPNTVRVHSANLNRKLGVHTQTQAAIALGWLALPSLTGGIVLAAARSYGL